MNLAPAKSRAWEYAIRRGFLTQSQIREAMDFALSSEGPTLREIREAINREAMKTPSVKKRDALFVALDAIDEVRGV